MANGDSGRGRANYPRSLISSPRPPCACCSTLTSAVCRPVQYIGHNRAQQACGRFENEDISRRGDKTWFWQPMPIRPRLLKTGGLRGQRAI